MHTGTPRRLKAKKKKKEQEKNQGELVIESLLNDSCFMTRFSKKRKSGFKMKHIWFEEDPKWRNLKGNDSLIMPMTLHFLIIKPSGYRLNQYTYIKSMGEHWDLWKMNKFKKMKSLGVFVMKIIIWD